MTVYILFFICPVIIYGPRVYNKHLNKHKQQDTVSMTESYRIRVS